MKILRTYGWYRFFDSTKDFLKAVDILKNYNYYIPDKSIDYFKRFNITQD